jgi:predicted dehydrogenase
VAALDAAVILLVTRRIGMGLVGPGFVGAHHIDAVRRLGFADVVAVAASSQASAAEKARALGVPKAYGSFEALAADPDIHVVHVTTPNALHGAVIDAALAHGKHVVCDKPLATTPAEARRLRDAAAAAGVIHAVTFNYRGNPMVQQARAMVAAGEIGPVHLIYGAYLQDWLLEDTDYSWRLDPGQGESSAMADIGSHWCDLAQHVSGQRIEAVLANLSTVVTSRMKPARGGHAFGAGSGAATRVQIATEDLGSVLLRFSGGATGVVTVGQVCAGHKNDCWLEVCGSAGSLRWAQEQQNQLWIGARHRPNAVMAKDPSFASEDARRYIRLPGGHQEGWADAFANVVRDIYAAIADSDAGDGCRPALATFDDGYRSACLVEAVVRSHRDGGVWADVRND